MLTTPRQIVSLIIATILMAPFSTAFADDIDIFLGNTGSATSTANILIVLDNTSNWSSMSAKWPGGIAQGQAEVRSIKAVVNSLKDNPSVNLGLMLISSVSGNPGGVIAFKPAPITAANIGAWTSWLDARDAKIQDPDWKAPSTASYGPLMFDVFKFFGGYTSPAHATDDVAGTPVSRTRFGPQRYADIATRLADPGAYTPDFSTYLPPLATDCIKNYIIFIGNGFPNSDSAPLLTGVGGDTTAILPNTMDGGSKTYLADEWARFLYKTDVSASSGQQPVVTYTIDVYGPAKPDALQSQYLANMAKQGGGKYFTANNESAILSALQQVVIEVQSVNDTFASASLPVNTANRSQDKNQVFIPMFRPDADARPRWLGNLKQYQLIDSAGSTVLGDATGLQAVNAQTGFVTDCASSFWTTDSGTYWANIVSNPSPRGKCPDTLFDPFSDAPDGPIVEKGGAAEVLRKGNNPPTTNTTPTYAVNRTLYTVQYTSASAQTGVLTAFNATSAAANGISATVASFISGQDTQDENSNANLTEARASIHGDAIHSRPLPVDYGGTTGVTVYYGANDGTFRAVDSTNGRERWSLIAPEFSQARLKRLQDNSPVISSYVPAGLTITPTPLPKDYFFDGSTGVYQSAGNAKVWIYPTTRRGGRMVYGIDVTNPALPAFKWKYGCPSLTNDIGCVAGAAGIGQTWSKPTVAARIAGYDKPVVIFGGGYDNCEDVNSATPDCTLGKGAMVYVLDADTGILVKSFPTPRAAVADVALFSSTANGIVDTAYVADMGGNISRIDFKSTVGSWTINRVAYSNGAGRKFLYPPALLQGPNGKVYLALGSGDREHPLITHYPYNGVTNRFYVYVDNLASTTAINLDDTTVINDNTLLNSCSTAEILPNSTARGYFLDLNQSGKGEQTVTSAIIVSGLASFSTNRPIAPVAGTCSSNLGEARGYWINLFNGAGAVGTLQACGGNRSTPFVGGGLPPSPVIGVVPVNGQLRTVVIGSVQRDGSASTPISPQEVKPIIKAKRRTIYWKSSGID